MRKKIIVLLTVLSTISIVLASFSPNIAFAGTAEVGRPDTYSPPVEDGSKSSQIFLPLVRHRQSPTWSMAAANPERTSWTAEEVKGDLKPQWFKVFEPYIPQKVQIIAAYGMLYVSTSAGLYALDAENGSEKWVYPTAMPLGHSPAVDSGVAYVGGFDRKLHAVNAYTGQRIWTFQAGAGFDTNPLVVEGRVYAGNRDGFFYALDAKTGQLDWKFQTQGPIHFSAAYKDGVVYFASNDNYAYALNAQTGKLVWKSEKLLGAGFHSWWPVVYQDTVIFSGSLSYRHNVLKPGEKLNTAEEDEIFPNRKADPKGTLIGPNGSEPGDWVSGTPTIDMSKPTVTGNGSTLPATEYLENKPWRRTYFVLDRLTGREVTYDFDQDGKPEYAPILWMGKTSGNRYPPVVGSDGVVYQANKYLSSPDINGGQVSGWKMGTPFISIVTSDWGAKDEPHAYSVGGNLIYWNLCCDRQAGAFDISLPNTNIASLYQGGVRVAEKPSGGSKADRTWSYFSYNLPELIPGYNVMTYIWEPYYKPQGGVYGGRNGIYGFHGDVNPPIPYQGKVYMHRSNAVIAFAPKPGSPTALPVTKAVDVKETADLALDENELKARLAAEIQKMLAAGHLRPGYIPSGIFDNQAESRCGDNMVDYWSNPAETLVTLIRALPHLPGDLQQATRQYLQNEFNAFPPYEYNHTGWKDGAARDAIILPPDVEAERVNMGSQKQVFNFAGWKFNPYAFYAMWKYAAQFGGAKEIFNAAKDRLDPLPPNEVLVEMPHAHNAFIAGYLGYLELQKLAGVPESAEVRNALNGLISLRVSTFSKDAPEVFFEDKTKDYCRSINISRNFIYLVPELANILHDNALDKVQQALLDYYRVAPLWFVSKFEGAFGEATLNPLYDYSAIFQAKAMILKEPRVELTRYLDVPANMVGDLFYIQNLSAALEAPDN